MTEYNIHTKTQYNFGSDNYSFKCILILTNHSLFNVHHMTTISDALPCVQPVPEHQCNYLAIPDGPAWVYQLEMDMTPPDGLPRTLPSLLLWSMEIGIATFSVHRLQSATKWQSLVRNTKAYSLDFIGLQETKITNTLINPFHTDSANPDLIRIPFTRPFRCSKNTLPYAWTANFNMAFEELLAIMLLFWLRSGAVS